MTPAPFFGDMADGPPGGRAFWCRAADDVRLRIGHWPADDARGTVLLLPGRTEYIEKYGITAADLTARGYGTLCIDWRGQGLADRALSDAMSGHVRRFADYQADVDTMIRAAGALDLPRPWHMLAHSMGGAIGLRALMNGLPVQSCAFSAPMWGIAMSDILRPVAWSLGWTGRRAGLGHLYAPGTTRGSYVLSEPFENNALTRDAQMHARMVAQLRAQPGLSLGGPSLHWLFEALRDCRTLDAAPSPRVPCLTFVGSAESIVDMSAIESRMARWPGARLEIVQGGLHELLMDTPDTRADIADMLADFWAGA